VKYATKLAMNNRRRLIAVMPVKIVCGVLQRDSVWSHVKVAPRVEALTQISVEMMFLLDVATVTVESAWKMVLPVLFAVNELKTIA